MRLFPARESRRRDWLPEDASSGAVPFQEANRSRLADRRGAGGVSEQPGGAGGPGAVQLHQGGPAGGDQPGELFVQGPGLLIDRPGLAGQLHGEPAAGLAGQVPRLDGGDQRAGLPGGQELPGPAGQQSPAAAGAAGRRPGCGPGRARRGGRRACPLPPGPPRARTWTRPGARKAASATECAPAGPVLRPLPAANTRTCADSSGGTPETISPSWTRRCARCRPMPLQPPTAQTRSANVRAAASISAYPALPVPYLPAASTTARSSMTSIEAGRLCGSIPMITPTIPPRLAR